MPWVGVRIKTGWAKGGTWGRRFQGQTPLTLFLSSSRTAETVEVLIVQMQYSYSTEHRGWGGWGGCWGSVGGRGGRWSPNAVGSRFLITPLSPPPVAPGSGPLLSDVASAITSWLVSLTLVSTLYIMQLEWPFLFFIILHT